MTTSRIPKWSKWRAVPSVKLWEGVALSLGIEPSEVRRTIDYVEGDRPFDEGEEFDDRLLVVDRNIENLRVTSLSLSYPHEATVELSSFAAWMKSIRWTMPPELEEIATARTDTESALHPKERTTLLKLVIGMAVKGFDYDPSATRSDVPKEIAAGLEGLGIGVDVDTVRKWLREGTALLQEQRAKPDR